jgi:RNA polymerase sigma factor (sigma-70 family)
MNDNQRGRDTSPSLLQRIRDPGDAASWKVFVDIYAPLIYTFLRRRGLQDADAADVGQEVLAQVGRSIRNFTYQPERGRFRDWLGAVTRNKLWRFLRRQSQLPEYGGSEAEEALREAQAPAADGEWTTAFNARVLEAALERVRPYFEPATWQAFEYTWISGRSASDVASATGRPIDAIYLAKSRVLKRLREEVMILADDFPQMISPGSRE